MRVVSEAYSIREVPQQDRPRERLVSCGAEALTAAELIAIILGSGSKTAPIMQLSQKLVAAFGGLHQLSEASIEELCQIKGIGPAKAIQLQAAFNLGVRLAKELTPPKFKVEHPIHAYQLVKDELLKEKREIFIVVLIDAKSGVIGQHVVSMGTLTQTLVHPREVFYPAIRHKAASIILAHNHPSGDLEPSRQDLELTEKLVSVGKILGIPVSDHIIISHQGYCSLRQKGLI